jgi:UDP-N-acetylmuramoyl-L-alanyl-D-glutamate--2,6-diaminopimelate ligase
MKLLKTLLDGLSCAVDGSQDLAIEDIVFDSRQVKPGALFVALRGVHQDGHGFIQAAVDAGARAVISETPFKVSGVTGIQVQDALRALAHVALRFWDFPSEKLLIVGITGTNGKTTISYLLESIFESAGLPTGVLGTINYRFRGDVVPAPNTTPFSSELQRMLARFLQAGAKACVMEVSSHALALGRVEGVNFDVGLFTNLTQDHLDFHKTLEAYAEAKAKLFESLDPHSAKPYPKRGIVNRDDPWSDRMAKACRVPVMGYRLRGPADVFAKNIECDATGSRFELQGPGVSVPVRLALLGEYNVTNAVAAAAVAFSQGLPAEAIVKGLERVQGIPGRMERINSGQPYTVVVDYAHTEDALRHVLGALRALRPRRLLTVFGCGGDRDRIKRPLMGEAAASLSDEVFVTSDNPRSEDPARITLDVEVGVRRVRADHYQIILDREEAIARALGQAQKGDIVLIAGKGHENYQILANRTIPFDDREVARRLTAAASTPS